MELADERLHGGVARARYEHLSGGVDGPDALEVDDEVLDALEVDDGADARAQDEHLGGAGGVGDGERGRVPAAGAEGVVRATELEEWVDEREGGNFGLPVEVDMGRADRSSVGE